MIKRIMIIGRSGSGKSTFAYNLHQRTGLPVYHLDKYFFTDNWIERDYTEFLNIQNKIVNEAQWIIDGNSTKSFEMRYSNTDLCIYFNFPKYICYWRVFKRIFFKNSEIDDRGPNCPETVSWSLLKYMWGFEQRVDPILKRLMKIYPNVQFIVVTSDEQLNRLKFNLKRTIT